jgi:sulfoxide reductase heme-binding subunit YedZ
MVWLKKHWRWVALNVFSVSVVVIVLTRGTPGFNAKNTFDPMLESGKWSIRFLLLCLAMSPLNTYLGWCSAIPLRKPAGLWAFGFACLHVFLLAVGDGTTLVQWIRFPVSPFIVLGILGITILSALAMTSNRWAMQRLGKNWKRLHRLVYVAGLVTVFHAVLAAVSSKKMWVRDPNAAYELNIYVLVLGILLLLRVPLVRNTLKRLPKLRPALLPKRA